LHTNLLFGEKGGYELLITLTDLIDCVVECWGNVISSIALFKHLACAKFSSFLCLSGFTGLSDLTNQTCKIYAQVDLVLGRLVKGNFMVASIMKIMHKKGHITINKDSTVTLREVTRENLRAILNLEVASEQRSFVAPNAVSIAQAHFYPEIAWFRAIYADETPVGFLMLSDDAKEQRYFLWRLMIDAKYQKLGFAKKAVELLFDYVRTRPGAKEILVSYVPGDEGPQGFYEKLGFTPTGEMEGDEVVVRLDL
jgi:diamine N-acetyltransferase